MKYKITVKRNEEFKDTFDISIEREDGNALDIYHANKSVKELLVTLAQDANRSAITEEYEGYDPEVKEMMEQKKER